MALSAGTVSLSVKADAKGFGAKLASDISREAKSSGLSGVGKAIGGTIMAGVGAAVVGIGAIIATGVGEAMDASAGTAQLVAGIKSTGNAANVSVKGMTDLASAIQGYSGQTDDSIVKSEQLLLTFTNIKNSGPDKIFDRATKASADMAAKMGGDASSNAILLGKALNDPVKGITALTRVGVSFTQGQKDSIKAMQDSGDTVGAQKIILAELTKEFGGAAEAAGNSLPGQLAKGKRAFEDMSQSVVEGLLPVVMPAITGLAGAVKNAAPFVIAFAEAFSKNLQNAIKNNAPLIKNVQDIIGGLGSFISKTLMPALMSFGKWLIDNKTLIVGLGLVILSLVAAFKAYNMIMGIVKIATSAWAVVQGILNGTLIANPIGLIIMAIAALVAGIIWVATQTTFFQDAWSVMTHAIATAWNWLWTTIIQPVFAAIGAIFKWLWTTIIQPIVNLIVGYVRMWAAIFTWLWNSIIWPIFQLFAMGFALLGLAAVWLWNNAIMPAVQGIGAVFQWLWNAIISPIVSWIGSAINVLGAVFRWLWGNIIAPVFQSIASIFIWLWLNIIAPVASWIGSAIGTIGRVIGSVFGSIGGVIRGAFSGVSDFIRGVINSVIRVVNGAIRGINGLGSAIRDATGGAIDIRLGQIPSLAEGGIVPATPGGRLVRVAEGGKDEIIGPLDKVRKTLGSDSDKGGDTFNIYEAVSARATAMQVSRRQIALGA